MIRRKIVFQTAILDPKGSMKKLQRSTIAPAVTDLFFLLFPKGRIWVSLRACKGTGCHIRGISNERREGSCFVRGRWEAAPLVLLPQNILFLIFILAKNLSVVLFVKTKFSSPRHILKFLLVKLVIKFLVKGNIGKNMKLGGNFTFSLG